MEGVDGPVGIDGEEGGAGRLTGSTTFVDLETKSLTGRLGAAPQSGRVWRS
jgi:hypothetical protein